MKANAPEKIYLQEPTKVRTEKKYDNDVEYTRTDAFIKKACEWLKFNLQDYAGEDSCRNSVPFDKDVFEAFRKAMEL